jgi:hypothetical protein
LQIVQNRKFLIPILAVLLVGVAVPLSVQRAHADDTSESLTIAGFLARGYSDSYLISSVDAVQAGNTLTFNVVFTANSNVYQRNITMGIKFDWMNNFQNTTSNTSIYAGQTVTVSLPFTIPALSGQYTNLNQAAHSWTLQVWDMAVGATWSVNTFCQDPFAFNPPFPPSCRQFTSFNFPNHPVGVYNSAQVSSYNSRLQASAILSALASAFTITLTPAPGTSGALASYSQAKTQMALGDSAYSIGDFNTAQTDYQNALNDANAAQSSLATIGGGTDTARFTSILLDSVAILLGGIAAILVGFSGFKYLRGKTRALPSYTPASSTPKA